jgi:hypothetical protein
MRRLAMLLLLPVACAAPSSTHLFGPAATDLPRTPLAIVFIPNQVAQGQDAAFTITLPPAAYAGGIPLIFTFSGEASGVDTLTLPPDSSGQPLQGDIQVPAEAPDGVLSVAISLPTTGQTATTTLTIKDTQAPQLSVSGLTARVAGFDARSLLLAGTTDTIVVSATDNHTLAWVGWSINAPVSLGDSVSVSGIASTVNLPIPVAASLAGDTLSLSVFAADSDGNVVTVSQPGVLVARVTTHPVQSVPRGGRVTDIAFDSLRGLMYLAKPDSQIVAVLSLSGLSYQAPIAVNGTPVAVDLSPGGDSLIVGLASPAAAAIVNLTSASHPVISTMSFGTADTLRSMRVTGDNKALAFANSAAVELDLASGATQALASGGSGCLGRPTRSGDHTHVMLLNCPTEVYVSTTHSFESGAYLSVPTGGVNTFTSANAAGSLVYQINHVLVDSTISVVFAGGYDQAYGAAVAPNGIDFYVGEGSADSLPGLYLHYVRPTTSPVELTLVPHPAYEFAVDRSGTTLIGITADTIFAIDLTQATAAQVATKHTSRRARRATARCAQPGAFQLQLPGTMRCVNKST